MLPTKAPMTHTDRQALEEGLVSFMIHCKFFAYYFYDKMELYPTTEIKTAGTDGRRIFFNPEYLTSLKPMERCFLLAHEVYHTIDRDPTKMAYYEREGNLRGLPFNNDLYNVAADYRINADLVASQIGTCNPAWLWDPRFQPDSLVEDIYVELYKQLPPPPPPPPIGPSPQGPGGVPGGQGQNPGNTGSGQQMPPPSTYGDSGKVGKGTKRDATAQAAGGRMDEVLPPEQDAATGKPDTPSETEFREAVSRAQAAAAGSMPGGMKRTVKEILDPQVSWRDHLRLKITGKVGNRRESWDHPNRRRLVLEPLVYMPGRQGNGAQLITVVIDNSGSIDERMLTVFFSECAAIVNDCRPKKVQVIWCDAKVQRVEEARSLDELLHIRVKGAEGGGGTSFRPPFAYLEKEKITPDTLVYLTDMYPNDGWPEEPEYPVIWAATTGIEGPFGETVQVKV